MFVVRLIMRIALYATLIAMISNGCTTINMIEDRLQSLSYVDSAIEPYVARFLNEAKNRRIKVASSRLTMVFGKTDDGSNDGKNTIGTCSEMNGYPVIFIDRDYWKISDDTEKEMLAFHELAHCFLNRDHCEIKADGRSVSIMEPSVDSIPKSTYEAHRNEYVDELFYPHDGCGLIK